MLFVLKDRIFHHTWSTDQDGNKQKYFFRNVDSGCYFSCEKKYPTQTSFSFILKKRVSPLIISAELLTIKSQSWHTIIMTEQTHHQPATATTAHASKYAYGSSHGEHMCLRILLLLNSKCAWVDSWTEDRVCRRLLVQTLVMTWWPQHRPVGECNRRVVVAKS